MNLITSNTADFEINPKIAVILKQFKIAQNVDIEVKDNILRFFYFDTKNYYGIVEVLMDVQNTLPHVFFTVDAANFIDALDQYILQNVITVNVNLNSVMNTLTLKNNTKTYTLPVSISDRIVHLKNLSDNFKKDSALGMLKTSKNDLNTLFKNLHAIDTEAKISVVGEDEKISLYINASKIDTYFSEKIVFSEEDSRINENICIKLVMPSFLEQFFKSSSEHVYLYFYENYLVLEYNLKGVHAKVYLPYIQ